MISLTLFNTIFYFTLFAVVNKIEKKEKFSTFNKLTRDSKSFTTPSPVIEFHNASKIQKNTYEDIYARYVNLSRQKSKFSLLFNFN